MEFYIGSPPLVAQHDGTDLPVCDCDMYMPPGQHDPLRHERGRGWVPPDQHDTLRYEPGRGWVPPTEEMIEASRRAVERAAEEAAIQAELAEKARISQRDKWIKATSRCADVTVQAARENRLLQTSPNASTLGELSQALRRHSKTGVFTCGGTVPIDQMASTSKAGHANTTSSAVTVRWGLDGHGRLLTLPVGSVPADTALQQLISDCIPATFGRNGKDVYDESYRRAGALSADLFTTDFCPYKLGIIDHIVQLLLPPVTGDLKANAANSMARGIRAELYKLNVYSAPSGMFKPHVDTPRGETQVGSLVVSLPTDFQGGTLPVRHQGQEFLHDWASNSPGEHPAIHWAAFYSDCEHEVLEVTSGHRITLTYNLFLASGTGLLNGSLPSTAPERLPLTHQLRRFLSRPDAMPAGGFLGIHLVHAYPHTDPKSHAFVPRMLKGADMAIYEALIACGLNGILTPRNPDQNLPLAEIFQALSIQDPQGHIEPHLHPLNPIPGYETTEGDGCDSPGTDWDCETFAPWWPDDETWSGDDDDDDDFQDMDEESESKEDKQKQWTEMLDVEAKDIGKAALERRDTKRFERQIVWLNCVGNSEISRVYMAYGNQAELEVKYSTVALIVKVPSWEERKEKVEIAMGVVEEGASEMAED